MCVNRIQPRGFRLAAVTNMAITILRKSKVFVNMIDLCDRHLCSCKPYALISLARRLNNSNQARLYGSIHLHLAPIIAISLSHLVSILRDDLPNRNFAEPVFPISIFIVASLHLYLSFRPLPALHPLASCHIVRQADRHLTLCPEPLHHPQRSSASTPSLSYPCPTASAFLSHPCGSSCSARAREIRTCRKEC